MYFKLVLGWGMHWCEATVYILLFVSVMFYYIKSAVSLCYKVLTSGLM